MPSGAKKMAKTATQQNRKNPEFFPPLTFSNAFS
jgi:hypothetical protein